MIIKQEEINSVIQQLAKLYKKEPFICLSCKNIIDEEVWNSNEYDNYYDSFFFFTETHVIILREYDGYEYFVKVPRDWKKLISSEEEK
jgi:hypothetical protein